MTPNRVNRALWPTKENRQEITTFCNCSVHEGNGLKWQGGREVIFPTNPDLADILGDMDFDFDNDNFLYLFGFQISKSRFPDFQNVAWAGLGLGRAGPSQAWALDRVGPQVGPLC